MAKKIRPHCWGRSVDRGGSRTGIGIREQKPPSVFFVPEIDVVVRAQTMDFSTILSDGFDVHILRLFLARSTLARSRSGPWLIQLASGAHSKIAAPVTGAVPLLEKVERVSAGRRQWPRQ